LFQSGEGTAFLAARQKPAPVAKKEQYAGIAYWIDLLRGDDSRVRTTARHEFKSGDRIKLYIKPNRDGYLYVVNTGTTGASRMLYPRAGGDGGNFVRAHHEYAVPDSSYIVFDDNPGIETVLVLLSTRPMPQLISPSPSIDLNETRKLVAFAQTSGAKDLLLEDDSDSAKAAPAQYAVVPASVLESGRVISLTINLKHRR
jgi:hypothetical protein